MSYWGTIYTSLIFCEGVKLFVKQSNSNKISQRIDGNKIVSFSLSFAGGYQHRHTLMYWKRKYEQGTEMGSQLTDDAAEEPLPTVP